ncbi:MAG: cysteine synthase A [Bacteroides sp.]|nr:cysteine synthase A [Bacteroides sp.]
MAKIANQLTDLIGNTPLLELGRYSKEHCLNTPLVAKLEGFNPGGSVKDRVALAMIEDAEQKELLKSGATIIEPTSGNTGIGLAMVSAIKGYRLILTMPETMSIERRNLLRALGAEIVLTDGTTGMKGSVERAEELKREIPGAVILQQFENPANPAAHQATTAEEIWRDTEGKIDLFVACVGTSGTVCGVGTRLKEYNSEIRVIAVEPASSPLLSSGQAGPHRIQGIGANFIPPVYDPTVVDEVFTVADDEAIRAGRELASLEGVLAGISSGAAVYAARQVALREEFKDKKIVALLPDTEERYLSTELYAFDAYILD